jgi:phosphopentomutase
MQPASAGKDSTSGHWELMCCVLSRPFPVYPGGFPPEIVRRFEKETGREVIGNKPASGTAIIEELGEEHIRTGRLILYTSQDSVFQIAAHESIVPADRLYEYCRAARSILREPHDVARVIARPFAGEPGGFYRTVGRRDFSLPPPERTVLDALTESGRRVLGIGKIGELFAGRGISHSIPTKSNSEGMDATLDSVGCDDWSLVFTNLVDFDMMWGHRNDARAYALGLEEFDSYLSLLVDKLDRDTLLIITSDHGNDPTTPSTDHSREYVPLLVYHHGLLGTPTQRELGTRETFADVGRTVAENFELNDSVPGEGFLGDVVTQSE